VAVLEQAAIGHPAGGSHGSCRIFRLGYADPEYVGLALLARELWDDLEASCGERLLHPAPQLTFGPQMARVQAAMREAGAPCNLLSAAEVAERFPCISVGGEALLEHGSAVIAADRALAALAALVWPGERPPGLAGTRATSLADDGRRVRIRTSAGNVEAARVVVCAGPWTAGLLATGGIAVPGSATLEQVGYLAPADPAAGDRAPIFIHYGGDFPYGLPVPGTGRYKIGFHFSGPTVDPDRQDHASDAALGRRIERAAQRFLPGFEPRPVAMERCVYDNSPDTDFIVDRVGNVVIGSGTSGHGFKFAPLLGEWLATLATDQCDRPGQAGTVAWPPPRFALSRF
jgi:sarcosine oxidase